MILGWLYDLAIWPYPWHWPWSFKVRVWNSFLSGVGWLTEMERKDVSRPFMTMILTSVTMVGWADVPNSDRVTSDVGVPSKYLVIITIVMSLLLSSYHHYYCHNHQRNDCCCQWNSPLIDIDIGDNELVLMSRGVVLCNVEQKYEIYKNIWWALGRCSSRPCALEKKSILKSNFM